MIIEWAGQTFELLAERALYWREKSTLIFSDVHLGKAHDFQAMGVPIPSAIHEEDLARIRGLLQSHQPRRVFVLGDFVHSHRTDLDDLVEGFKSLKRDFDSQWTLALGNHDWRGREKLEGWGFDDILLEIEEDRILFSHDPGEHRGFAIYGHVHPVIRLGGGRDRLRLPCFVVSQKRILLPSFGSFTGGFEIKARPADRIFVAAHGEVVNLACSS